MILRGQATPCPAGRPLRVFACTQLSFSREFFLFAMLHGTDACQHRRSAWIADYGSLCPRRHNPQSGGAGSDTALPCDRSAGRSSGHGAPALSLFRPRLARRRATARSCWSGYDANFRRNSPGGIMPPAIMAPLCRMSGQLSVTVFSLILSSISLLLSRECPATAGAIRPCPDPAKSKGVKFPAWFGSREGDFVAVRPRHDVNIRPPGPFRAIPGPATRFGAIFHIERPPGPECMQDVSRNRCMIRDMRIRDPPPLPCVGHRSPAPTWLAATPGWCW